MEGDHKVKLLKSNGVNYLLAFYGGYFVMAFPTIYGISLKGLGDDAKFGAAGLIMAILGGSVLPPLQSSIIDLETIGNSFPAVNASFILSFISFAVIAWYGGRVACPFWYLWKIV